MGRRRLPRQDVYTDISIHLEVCGGFAVYFGKDDSRNRSGFLKCIKSVQAENRAVAIACEINARDETTRPTFWTICTDCLTVCDTAGNNFRNLTNTDKFHGAKHPFSRIGRSVRQIQAKGHIIDIVWVRRESTKESIAVDRLASEAARDAFIDGRRVEGSPNFWYY